MKHSSTVNPLVSVIIPTYNRADLIGETVQSVLDQSYTNWELIIVDDGSTDNTASLIEQYHEDRIKYIQCDHIGIFGAVRNAGMRIAKGDYLAFLDSDDLWREDKLSITTSLLTEYDSAGFLFSNVRIFGNSTVDSPELEDFFIGDLLLPLLKDDRFIFYPSSLIFRREVFTRIGDMRDDLNFGTDIEYLYRMCKYYQGIFINTRLTSIRKHEQNSSSDFTIDVFKDNLDIVLGLRNEGCISGQDYRLIAAFYFYKMGLISLERNDGRSAMKYFFNYNQMNPLQIKGWIRLLQSIAAPRKVTVRKGESI
jgi:glycosyltransferase involved in cell wall biosynthesis